MKNADYLEYLISREKLDRMIFKEKIKGIDFVQINKRIGSERYTLYILKVLLAYGPSSINDIVKYFTKNSNIKLKLNSIRVNFYKHATGDNEIIGLEKLGFIEESGKKSQNAKQPMTYTLTPNGVIYCWHLFSENNYNESSSSEENKKIFAKREQKLLTKEINNFIDPIFKISADHYAHHFPLILGKIDLIKKTCKGTMEYLIRFADAEIENIEAVRPLMNSWHYRKFIVMKNKDEKIHNDITFFFFAFLGPFESGDPKIPNKELLFGDKDIHDYCKDYIENYHSQSAIYSKDMKKQWSHTLEDFKVLKKSRKN